VAPSSSDRCEQAAEYGGCSELLERWFWDQLSGKCDRFWYSGCHGNDNNFETETDCHAACGHQQMTTEGPDVETDREGQLTTRSLYPPLYTVLCVNAVCG